MTELTKRLVIDVGNTNTNFAIVRGTTICADWQAATDTRKTADDYGVWLNQLMLLADLQKAKISEIVVCSVVPEMDYTIQTLASRYYPDAPLRNLTMHDVDMPIDLAVPGEVGIDRLVNARAAIKQYGKPAIIVDFGTATTFDVISAEGAFKGGIIAPGPGVSLQALHQAAAKLPKVAIKPSTKVVGTTTVQAMQSGVFWGYVSMVEGLLARIIQEEFQESPPHIICTGGLGGLFQPHIASIQSYQPQLTLSGLAEIAACANDNTLGSAA